MIRPTLFLTFLAFTSLGLSACAGEDPSTRPEGLTIQLTPENQGQAPCRIERIARIDQDQFSLYMVRGESRYLLENGETRNIPIQIQFRGLDGITTDTVITLTDFETPCDQVAIDWQIESCQNQDREIVTCPPLEISGQEAFRQMTVSIESS